MAIFQITEAENPSVTWDVLAVEYHQNGPFPYFYWMVALAGETTPTHRIRMSALYAIDPIPEPEE